MRGMLDLPNGIQGLWMAKLHRISEACDNPQRKADVVFIHGLGGDAFATWRHGEGDDTSWPHWLAAEFPDLGVWSLGYTAKPVDSLGPLADLFRSGKRDTGQSMSLPDRAVQVLDLMRLDARFRADCPVVFVCHSLGGLLAKQILRQANDHLNHADSRAMTRRIAGVLFLATPHQGAVLASLANRFSTIFGPSASLAALKAHDPHLRNLYNWYRSHAPSLGIATQTYYEGRDVFGFRIVDETSSQPGVGPDAVMLDEDHLSIAKPRDRSAQVCLALNALLRVVMVRLQTTSEANDSASSEVPSERPLLGLPAPSDEPVAEQGSHHHSDPRPTATNGASDTNRQVFISYAADDPDWTEDHVMHFAAKLDALPVFVRLDVRFEESQEMKLAPAEWRRWMDESLEVATHIICLCSERYALAWAGDESLSGGCGVAFEASRIERYLSDKRQKNRGRVLVVMKQGRLDLVPTALRDACPQYVLGNAKDDRLLRLHLSAPKGAKDPPSGPDEVSGRAVGTSTEQESPRQNQAEFESAGQERTIPLDREMLKHQADHAVERLERAEAYWNALRKSKNLNKWLTSVCLVSPLAFVKSLHAISPRRMTEVMHELRELFKDAKPHMAEHEARDAAAATVACFLYCACATIDAKSDGAVIGLPSVVQKDAAYLLASLIALVLAGGRLELRHGGGVLPRGSGAYRVQSTGIAAQFDFERQLYFSLPGNRWNLSNSQKTGALSDEERKELLVALEKMRGMGARTQTMCFIIDGDASSVGGVDVAATIGVPVFHASAEVTNIIFGVDEATIVSHLKHLWEEVCAHHAPDADDSGDA